MPFCDPPSPPSGPPDYRIALVAVLVALPLGLLAGLLSPKLGVAVVLVACLRSLPYVPLGPME